MRYFLELSYLGTSFCGWQRQPNGLTVQEALETALSTILRESIEITGCGRTDSGVHARYYVAHFDANGTPPATLLQGLNSLLPDAVAVRSVTPVSENAHARFDAFERSYEYYITAVKDPFVTEMAWYHPAALRLDRAKMQEVASLLPQYKDFFPFCKADSGLDTYACALKSAAWRFQEDGNRMVFTITSNRFLRGMVRLIVGACIQAGQGQLLPSDVKEALQVQKSLSKSLSVPAHGLFLTDVKYPEHLFRKT
jgi:tRNA pseudouridine38-40 synthase